MSVFLVSVANARDLVEEHSYFTSQVDKICKASGTTLGNYTCNIDKLIKKYNKELVKIDESYDAIQVDNFETKSKSEVNAIYKVANKATSKAKRQLKDLVRYNKDWQSYSIATHYKAKEVNDIVKAMASKGPSINAHAESVKHFLYHTQRYVTAHRIFFKQTASIQTQFNAKFKDFLQGRSSKTTTLTLMKKWIKWQMNHSKKFYKVANHRLNKLKGNPLANTMLNKTFTVAPGYNAKLLTITNTYTKKNGQGSLYMNMVMVMNHVLQS